jgi:hypothetical protein
MFTFGMFTTGFGQVAFEAQGAALCEFCFSSLS